VAMDFQSTNVADARLIHLTQHSDARGDFVRTWCLAEFESAGITFNPIQANMSSTRTRGTIRGMHFQREPRGEAKLVRCSKGRIWDVIADLRPKSSTFGRTFGVELSCEGATALYIPAGFAHGFQALTDDVAVDYLMDERYVPELADGFRYDDPATRIEWPLPARLVSEKDLAWPPLSTRSFWIASNSGPAGQAKPVAPV